MIAHTVQNSNEVRNDDRGGKKGGKRFENGVFSGNTKRSVLYYALEWVKEWWQVSHFVFNFCSYSPYCCTGVRGSKLGQPVYFSNFHLEDEYY